MKSKGGCLGIIFKRIGERERERVERGGGDERMPKMCERETRGG